MTPTFTHTQTGTLTPVDTDTFTPTATMTDTPNPPTLSVSVGGSSPSNSNQQPGVTGLPVLQVSVNNPSNVSVTLTYLVLSASGTGNDLTGIDSVVVYADMDGDGLVGSGDVTLGTAAYPVNNGNATIPLSDSIVPPSSSMSYLVVYNFSSAASIGTYRANINASGLSGTSSYGDVSFSGLPITGAIITIMQATDTPTSVFTPVPSETPTATPTRTWTPLSTATPSHTLVPTFTSTPTASRTGTPSFTPTPSHTPLPSSTPTHTSTQTATGTKTALPVTSTVIVYPNPSDGTQPVKLGVPGRTAESVITVQIFTAAFRLVQQKEFLQVPLGTDIQIELVDKTGKPLASGLYYVVVRVDNVRTIGKLLLLR